MASAADYRMDLLETLLLEAGWDPCVMRNYILSFYADARRPRTPTVDQTNLNGNHIHPATYRWSSSHFSTLAQPSILPSYKLSWRSRERPASKPDITITPVDVKFFTSTTLETAYSQANLPCLIVLFKTWHHNDSATKPTYFVQNTTIKNYELACRLTALEDATELLKDIQRSPLSPSRPICRLPVEILTRIFQIELCARIYDIAAVRENAKISRAVRNRKLAKILTPPGELLPDRFHVGHPLHWAVLWEKLMRHCVLARAGALDFNNEPRLREEKELWL